jgi:hypothetical protein
MSVTLEPRDLSDAELARWSSDFEALCLKHRICAAFYIPVVKPINNKPFVVSVLTGGEGRSDSALGGLLKRDAGPSAIQIPDRWGR